MDTKTAPTKLRASKYFGIYLGIILFVLSFGLGTLVGKTWYLKKQITTEDGSIDITKVINIDRSINKSESVDFNQFWTVWDKIKDKHARQSISEVDLFYGAMQGLVAGIGDPYSVYFPPKPAEEFIKGISGEFSGIGAEIGIKNNNLVIISPLPDSPALRAGLRPADRIVTIDGALTTGIDINSAVNRIRGPAGTTTTLGIGREGQREIKDVIITRAKISIPAVMFELLPGGVAYLRIMQFNSDTLPSMSRYIQELKNKGANKIVLDLRNNPGGFLDSAVQLASEWVGDGVIVSEQFSNGEVRNHNSVGQHRLVGFNTAVLVNGGSASASEIVAGALQDYSAATIIGTQTFGKGSVQDFEGFPDGSALKLTIAEWLTPNRHNINEAGVTPDLIVEEDFASQDVGEDPVLEKALAVLQQGLPVEELSE